MTLLTFFLACSPTTEDSGAAPPTSFRVAVLSDTHVIGPQYTCCSENGDLDNASIMRTNERLAEAVDRINAIDPPVELVLLAGDIVHDARLYDSLEAYQGQEHAWSRAGELLGRLRAPYHIAWGNHDYDFSCNDAVYDRALTHGLFDRWLGAPPFEQVDHKGWRFLLANSQLGPTFELGNPRCDGGLGSFGAEQLAWLDTALQEGLPSVVLSHHYLVVTASNEDPDGRIDFETVLGDAPNLQLVLAGHSHRWITFDRDDFDQVLVAGTRYDPDNFWVLDMALDGSGFDILDAEKARNLDTCADTWVYDGTPMPDPSAPAETGDCAASR